MYIIKVVFNGEEKFLRSKKLLIYHPNFAIRFPTPALARKYIKESIFSNLTYSLEQAPKENGEDPF